MAEDPNDWEDATKLIRGGLNRSQFREQSEPIYLTQAFTYESAAACDELFDKGNGFVYSRYANPTTKMFEDRLALLEGAEACRSTASSASVASIPTPSSSMRTRRLPPCSIVMPTRVAPASMAFSTSSLTTLAGRSTTSPAAIWLASSGGRRWMTDMCGAPRRRQNHFRLRNTAPMTTVHAAMPPAIHQNCADAPPGNAGRATFMP